MSATFKSWTHHNNWILFPILFFIFLNVIIIRTMKINLSRDSLVLKQIIYSFLLIISLLFTKDFDLVIEFFVKSRVVADLDYSGNTAFPTVADVSDALFDFGNVPVRVVNHCRDVLRVYVSLFH